MNLSVIIPTKNRAKILEKALDSLLKQTIKQSEFEVLVIDNGSTDETKKITDNYFNKILNLKYFYDEVPGLHTGRHRGLKESKSDILVYADDDIEAFPTWLESIKNSFDDPKVMLVGGKNLPKYEVSPPKWVLEIWDKNNKINGYLSILDLGEEIKEIEPYFVFGCNFSIRKKIVLEAGGFHPDGMPQNLIKFRGDGETYISKYIKEKGLKTLYNPKASVYHLISKDRLNLEYFKNRSFNQGISDSYTKIRSEGNYNYKNTNLKNKIKKLILPIYNKLINNQSFEEKEILKSYNQGFEFHQKEVKKDRDLLNWVLKKNYL